MATNIERRIKALRQQIGMLERNVPQMRPERRPRYEEGLAALRRVLAMLEAQQEEPL